MNPSLLTAERMLYLLLKLSLDIKGVSDKNDLFERLDRGTTTDFFQHLIERSISKG